MMVMSYVNRWMPRAVLDLLASAKGSILDVGGGAAPYCGADHIVDVQPYDRERLLRNRWGSSEARFAQDEGAARRSRVVSRWRASDYTQLDVCETRRWPFADDTFELGLCSHCLEDLRDPLPAVRELSRTCRNVLIVTPSRLLEQTKGIDHPRYCGFYHHPWMVSAEGDTLVFRRKTPLLLLAGCHLRCHMWQTLKVEHGAAFFYGSAFNALERTFWHELDEYRDYCDYLRPFRGRRDLFERRERRLCLRHLILRARQTLWGAV